MTDHWFEQINNRLDEIDGTLRDSEPLSFRDQCAIAAMEISLYPMYHNSSNDQGLAFNVSVAFDIADAMEAERKKRGGQ